MKSAIISDCGKYRYALHRHVNALGAGNVLFVMLNPSTADAEHDDATIRRCIGFARDWGYEYLSVGNLFAWRATHPSELYAMHASVANGSDNDQHLDALAANANEIVLAWGAGGGVTRGDRETIAARAAGVVESMLARRRISGTPIVTLSGRRTSNEQPLHPLYLAAAIERVRYA